MGFTNKYLNKYYYSITNQLLGVDNSGGLFLPHPTEKETILHLNQNYEVIKEIKIEDLYQSVKFENNFGFPKHQSIYNISVIDHYLFISLQDNTTCIVDENGEIVNILKVYISNRSEKYDNINYTLRCAFKKLNNGQIITIAHTKSHGSQIAISTDSNPDYLSQEYIKSKLLTNTFDFPLDYMCPLYNLENNETQSIGEILFEKANQYSNSPELQLAQFTKHLNNARIWDSIELDSNHLLLFLYTNLSSKSNSPDKNIPYYFCKLNKNTGEVVKMISPSDRDIFSSNLFPKFIRNNERIIFKTLNSVFTISDELILSEIVTIKTRHLYKKFFPVLYDKESIHYIIPDKTELFSYSNSEKIEDVIEQLVKSYKSEKKEIQ